MARLVKRNVSEAILRYSGNLTAVARAFDVSRQAVYNLLEKYPELWELVREARETMLDNVESTLYKQALEGNTAAMIFFLKTQGKARGYIERTEHAGPDNGPIKVRLSDD